MNDDQSQLLEMTQLGFIAFRNSEPALLEAILAPEFVTLGPGMPEMSRAAFLEWVRSSTGTIVSVEGESLGAHVFGETGVVSGVQRSHFRTEAGEVLNVAAFTQVFVRRDGRWQAVYSYWVPWDQLAATVSP
ncbi:nuclear transport factor 2 family protein [Pendulispora rubella]|uniref:Nuclear transport factor 2 family protein n=1 Tax=Pendulispora rubella TaxID=2741070 RepID=A0ABZ2L2Q1_9BACT